MTEDREIIMREMEEEASKNSIVSYDKSAMKAKGPGAIQALQEQIEKACQCEVEHLDGIGAFLLHYKSADHPAAAQFLDIPDVSHASEDFVVHMDEFAQVRRTH